MPSSVSHYHKLFISSACPDKGPTIKVSHLSIEYGDQILMTKVHKVRSDVSLQFLNIAFLLVLI